MTTKWQQEYEENKQKTLRTPITLADIENITDNDIDITGPMWHTIDIYDSYEQYLASAEKFTIEQRFASIGMVFCGSVQWLTSSIFLQFNRNCYP